MFIWESDSSDFGRVRREQGVWGCVVIGKESGVESILENECGSFPLPEEEILMSEKTGSVGMSCGLTVNMGNYESARVDCWLTLPCTEESADESCKKCMDFVTKKVSEKAKKYRKEK